MTVGYSAHGVLLHPKSRRRDTDAAASHLKERTNALMTVLIAALEDPSLDARVGGSVPDYRQESGEFALNRPIGDDWGQYIRYVPNPAAQLVRIEGRTMFVVFAALEDAVRFDEWLRNALREQKHGFNTMRG